LPKLLTNAIDCLSIVFQISLAGVAFFSAKKLNEKAARLRRMK
jgi:hypothetical protein